MISQDLSEFALHARAILGLPVPATLAQHGPSASAVILGEGHSEAPRFAIADEALTEPNTQLRLFGKPSVNGERRLGVGLARAETVEAARDKAKRVADGVAVEL